MIYLLVFAAVGLHAQQVTFRGVNHCGIYPNEKNLLKTWPAGGPEKLWVADDAGKGNSSALACDGFIYTAGLTEDEQEEQLTCFDLSGKKVWQVTDGSGACFAHPTIFDGILYVRHGSALIAYNIKQ